MDILFGIYRFCKQPARFYFPEEPAFVLESCFVSLLVIQLLYLLIKFECTVIQHEVIVEVEPDRENIYYREIDTTDVRIIPRKVKDLKEICETQILHHTTTEVGILKPLFPTDKKSLATLWNNIIERKYSDCTLKSQIESTKEFILLNMCTNSPYEIRSDHKFRAPKQVTELLNKYTINELLGKPMLSHFLQMQIDCVVKRRNNFTSKTNPNDTDLIDD